LRECRGCTFQNSCRDTVYRARNQAAPAYAPPNYIPQQPMTYAPAPAYAPAPQQFRQPMQQAPMPVVQPAQVPTQVPTQALAAPRQASPLYPVPAQYDYGWLHDPLHQAMSACPPPIRPQLMGETFVERVAKNMFLSAAEAFFMHGFLAIRQLVLPPEPKPPQEPQDFNLLP
jgi:hypothetical protein